MTAGLYASLAIETFVINQCDQYVLRLSRRCRISKHQCPDSLLKLYERVTLYQRQLARKRVENPKSYNSVPEAG